GAVGDNARTIYLKVRLLQKRCCDCMRAGFQGKPVLQVGFGPTNVRIRGAAAGASATIRGGHSLSADRCEVQALAIHSKVNLMFVIKACDCCRAEAYKPHGYEIFTVDWEIMPGLQSASGSERKIF